MLETELIKWALFAALGGFVWFLKRTVDSYEQRITRVETEMNQVKANYLHKDDFKEFKIELKSMFEEIKSDIKSLRDHRQ